MLTLSTLRHSWHTLACLPKESHFDPVVRLLMAAPQYLRSTVDCCLPLGRLATLLAGYLVGWLLGWLAGVAFVFDWVYRWTCRD